MLEMVLLVLAPTYKLGGTNSISVDFTQYSANFCSARLILASSHIWPG